MLLTKQISNAKAVFQARREYHKMKQHYTKLPTPTPHYTLNKSAALPLLAHRSIVFDFYICRKKK